MWHRRLPTILLASLLAVLALAGCDDRTDTSDAQQYHLYVGLQRHSPASRHVLVGSEFDVGVVELAVEGELDKDGGGLGCATLSGSGVISEIDDDRFRVDAAGAGAIEIADPGDSCPANDDILAELGPDRWSVTGVTADQAVARWSHSVDAAILGYFKSPGPRAVFPDALGRPLDELLVVADADFTAEPMLTLGDDVDAPEVRFADPDDLLEVPAHYDELRPTYENPEGTRRGASLEGRLRAGEGFDAHVTILGTRYALPPTRALPVEAITSLELVPFYDEGDAQREWGLPFGVIAITRDGDGRRVIGAPVEFELTRGNLEVSPFQISDESTLRDLIILGDTCRDAPNAPTLRSATIEASLGELQTSVDLDWIALPSDPGSRNSDDSNCARGACECSSTPADGHSWLGLLALLALGMHLRRRPLDVQSQA